MRHPLRLALIALAATLPSAAEDAAPKLEDLLPADMPEGRPAAAESLRSGVPQLVIKALEDVMFAQDAPAFEPWRVALEGKARSAAGELWVRYLFWLRERELMDEAFTAAAADWFARQENLPLMESAKLTQALRCHNEVLAKRYEEAAAEGNTYALMALASNTAGHPKLLELCRENLEESRKIVRLMAASYARSEAFRPLFTEWMQTGDHQARLAGLTGLLRLGNPDDVTHAARYLDDLESIRRFEVYRGVSWIKSKASVDLLLREQPLAREMNRGELAKAIGRLDDDRILPKLRSLRDDPGYTEGVVHALWRAARAADVPWLLARMEEGSADAAMTLRRKLGKDCPIEFVKRAEGVRAWIAAHGEAIERDEALPPK